MPTVAREGGFSFLVHSRELPFEPPHVHVLFAEDEVRIELASGTFLEDPPPAKRRTILEAYRRHVEEIWACWEALHGPIHHERT
jgi:hypothetical protein